MPSRTISAKKHQQMSRDERCWFKGIKIQDSSLKYPLGELKYFIWCHWAIYVNGDLKPSFGNTGANGEESCSSIVQLPRDRFTTALIWKPAMNMFWQCIL